MTLGQATVYLVRRFAITIFALALVFPVLAGAQSSADRNSPSGLVAQLLNAMQANDAKRIRSLFAENAQQSYGNGKPKSGDAFRAWLQSDIISVHGRVENSRISAKGNDVIVTGQYRNTSGYRSKANFLFKVANGKIVSWQMRY